MSDSKSCSVEDGSILTSQDLHRVNFNGRSAVIRINSWASTVKGIEFQVSLDFISTAELSMASQAAHDVILRLFPEEFDSAKSS